MLTTKQKRDEKENFASFASQAVAWLESALNYLVQDRWQLSVRADGKYQPGTTEGKRPSKLYVRTFNPSGWIAIDLPGDVPRRREELDDTRDRIHYTVSKMLIGTIGTRATNKALKDLRDAHGLKPVRKTKEMAR